MKDVWCKYFVYNCWYTWYKCINKVFFFPWKLVLTVYVRKRVRMCVKTNKYFLEVLQHHSIHVTGNTYVMEDLWHGSCWLTVCGLKCKNTSKHTSINSYSKSSEATVRIHLHLVSMAVWDDSKYHYSRFVTHPSAFSFPAECFTSWRHAKHVAV